MHRLCLTPCLSIQSHQQTLFYISPQFISRSLLYFAILYSAVKSPADFVWHFAEINPNSASLRPGFNLHFWPPWFTTKYFAQTMQPNTIIWGSLQNTSFYTILCLKHFFSRFYWLYWESRQCFILISFDTRICETYHNIFPI